MKIGDFETHPAADAFPMMDDRAFNELADDIKTRGLEHAIVYVNQGKRQLILDGRNRARACIQAKVKAKFIEYRGKDPVGYVVSLNLKRRHMDESQRAMVAARLAKLELGANQHRGSANLPTQAKAAEMLNVGDRTVRHARTVLERAAPEVVKAVDEGRMKVSAAAELAERPVAEQRDIASRSGKEIRTGHVRAMIRQNQRRETVRKINSEMVAPLPIGPFRVIVADVPWPYENSDGHAGARGHITYPPMSIDAICRLGRDVDKLAHDDSILAFWTTNLFMKDTPRLISEWGFSWVSMQTWTKTRAGMGIAGPRGRTEHVIYAFRGKPVHTLNEVSTWLADRAVEVPREHSRKPPEFYEVIEKHCPGAKLEMFARDPREGWARWGAESELFAKGAA